MTDLARAPLGRYYEIHGLPLFVTSEDPASVEALDLRLESFRTTRTQAPQLRLEFLTRRAGRPTRLPRPAEPSRPVYEAPDGDVQYHPACDTLYAEFDDVRMLCQAARGLARIESRDFAGRALYLATHALATICLIELFKRRGRFNLHAACLECDGRGVLLAGPSGAGKSTLAIGLVRAGLSFLSDDMVYIAPAAAATQILAFPDAVGITDETADLFPELRAALGEPAAPGFPKRLVRMQTLLNAVESSACPASVLIFPELSGEEPSHLVDLDPRDALLRLVPDILLTAPEAAQAHLTALTALVSHVECHVLRAGLDVAHSVRLILSLLPDHAGHAANAGLAAGETGRPDPGPAVKASPRDGRGADAGNPASRRMGDPGLEPGTSSLSEKRSNRLS